MLTRTKPQKSWVQEDVWKKHHWKHSEVKEPYEMLDKTKTLTTIARQNAAKEIALI